MTDTLPATEATPAPIKRGRGRPPSTNPTSPYAEQRKIYRETHKGDIKAYYEINAERIKAHKREAYAALHGLQPKTQCEYIGPIKGRCTNMTRRTFCGTHTKH